MSLTFEYYEEDWDERVPPDPEDFNLHIYCPVCKGSPHTNRYGFIFDWFIDNIRDDPIVCECGARFKVLAVDKVNDYGGTITAELIETDEKGES